MANEPQGEGNSTILPKNDNLPVTGNTYGYPGGLVNGMTAAQIEPTVRNNGKVTDKR